MITQLPPLTWAIPHTTVNFTIVCQSLNGRSVVGERMNTFTCSWMHLCATYTARPFWVHWIMTEGAQTSRLGLYTHTGTEVDEVQAYVHNSEGTVGMSSILEDRFLCHFLMTKCIERQWESVNTVSVCRFMSSTFVHVFMHHQSILISLYWKAGILTSNGPQLCSVCDVVYVCISWPFNVGSDLQLTQQSTRS